MNKETFKSLMVKAKHIIIETESNKNIDLMGAFYDYYDDLAPFVFPQTFSRQRLDSPGFKLYVQQVLDLVYELDRTTRTRNEKLEKAFEMPNVLNLNDFRMRKHGHSANGDRSLRTS